MAPKVTHSAHHTMSRKCSTFQLFACHHQHVSIFFATTKEGGGCFSRVLKLRLEPETSEWNARSFQMSASLVSLCSFPLSVLPTVGHFYLCVCSVYMYMYMYLYMYMYMFLVSVSYQHQRQQDPHCTARATPLHPHTNTQKEEEKKKKREKQRKREEKERRTKGEREREKRKRKEINRLQLQPGPSGELFPITVTGVLPPENQHCISLQSDPLQELVM